MLFARNEEGKERLYHVSDGPNPAGPAPVSPPASAIEARGETAPSLEVLPDGTLIAVYSVALPGQWNSELRAQRSTDGGATWSDPVRINDDASPGSHAFASTAMDSSGDLLVAWLDSREGQQGLAFSRSRDGLHFTRNRTVDPKTCQCCATAVATGHSGTFWIAYRDLEGNDLRDIASVRGSASSTAFGPLVSVSRDGWHVNGCPESGPRLAVDSGALWVVWFTGAEPGVFAASSTDGGRHFSRRTLIARDDGNGGIPNHPEIAVLSDGYIAVLYEARASVFARVLSADGASWSPAVKILDQATHARIASSAAASAVSYTGRNGNETIAVASTNVPGLFASTDTKAHRATANP